MRQAYQAMLDRLWPLALAASAAIACSGDPKAPAMARDEALAIAKAQGARLTDVDLEAPPSNMFEDKAVWQAQWFAYQPWRHATVIVDKADREVLAVFPNTCARGRCPLSATAPRMSEQEAIAIARKHAPEDSWRHGRRPTRSWEFEKAWVLSWEDEQSCGGGPDVLVDKRSRKVVGAWASQ